VKQDNYYKDAILSYPVYLGSDLWNVTGSFLQPFILQGNAFLLADTNTQEFCLPLLKKNIPGFENIPAFILPAGEGSKDLAQFGKILKWLMVSGASRNSLLINLGGGVVTDIGGFAAAAFNRGMKYINLPTTLMGQVDAAIGGKTGINVGGVKNQAGLFYDPLAVFILPEFLETLPEEQTRSGFAEIVKCAALAGKGAWEIVKNSSFTDKQALFNLTGETVKFKCKVVAEDPFDLSSRKMLNFGHTAGHGLESFHISLGRKDYLHGDAVAAGMICESWISHETAGLPGNELEEITELIISAFHPDPIEKKHYSRISSFMDYDKKKTVAGIGYSLLEKLGKPVLGRTVDRDILYGSFDYYNNVITK
jgi:3-dehydroquinate synthase